MKARFDRYRRGSDTWDSGDYYVTCDRCNFKLRRSQAKKTWDGLIVCPFDFEERHPQDFKRGRVDKVYVDDPNPEPSDSFVATNEVQPSDL